MGIQDFSAGRETELPQGRNVYPLTPRSEPRPALINFSELREELHRAEIFRLEQRSIHHRIQTYLEERRIAEFVSDRERAQALLDQHLSQRHDVPLSLLEQQKKRELLGKMGL